jgi:hypothetical protein
VISVSICEGVGDQYTNGAPMMSTLRYARISEDRAAEWVMRMSELTQEFASEPRDGEVTYGLLVAYYPTDRPHLPDSGDDQQ